jgi:hypothetical protein
MERRHFRALLKVEVARHRTVVTRLLLTTAALVAVFWVAGKRGPDTMLAVVLGAGLGSALIVPMGVTRDRLEGTLAFLTGLPTRPATIAAARFAVVVFATAPWALLAAFGMLPLARELEHGPPPLAAALGTALLAWIGLTTIGWVLTGVLSRWDLAQMLGVPIIVAVIALLVLPRLLRPLVPADPVAWLTWFLAQAWAPVAIGGGLVGLALLAGAVSFGLAVRGIARYDAGPGAR